MSCDGGSDGIDDHWAGSSPVLIGPLPHSDSASTKPSSVPQGASKKPRLLTGVCYDASDDPSSNDVPRFASILKLQTRPELVGQKVKLVAYDSERKRYGCELASGQQLSVSEENLMILRGVFADSAEALFLRK